MALDPFASMEARINAATTAKLANVLANFSGVIVPAVFDDTPQNEFDVHVKTPRLRCLESLVLAVQKDSAVVVRGTAYKVKSKPEIDSGMAHIELYLA